MLERVFCFAAGWPSPRAECVIGGVELVEPTPMALALALSAEGASDGLFMLFRYVNKVQLDGRMQSGYCSATLRAFAEGRDIPLDTKLNWTQRVLVDEGFW